MDLSASNKGTEHVTHNSIGVFYEVMVCFIVWLPASENNLKKLTSLNLY